MTNEMLFGEPPAEPPAEPIAEPAEEGPGFEQSLEQLERVVADLEAGNIGLEEAIGKYEQGVALLKGCYSRLRHAERRIQELTGQDEKGAALLRPFDHAATVDAGQRAEKRTRRTKPTD